MTASDYSFGLRLLDDPANGYYVDACDVPSAPAELLEYPLGNYEGAIVSGVRYGESDAMVRVKVEGSAQATTETRVSALVTDLYRAQQQLKLGYVDERFWLARLQGRPTITRLTHGMFQVEASFRTTNAFAFANSSSSLINNAALSLVSGTHYSKLMQPTVGGNMYSRPVINITVPGGGPYGMTQIYIENEALTPTPRLTITRAFLAGDFIEIDAETLSVLVNAVQTDYAGQFILLDPRVSAVNDLRVHAIATSTPTLNVQLLWRPRFAA